MFFIYFFCFFFSCLFFFFFFFFFFQAEDGIRDKLVTGVQTCALPISSVTMNPQTLEIAGAIVCLLASMGGTLFFLSTYDRWCFSPPPRSRVKIGRASCRERV